MFAFTPSGDARVVSPFPATPAFLATVILRNPSRRGSAAPRRQTIRVDLGPDRFAVGHAVTFAVALYRTDGHAKAGL